jgi:hypothetical protein
VELITVQPMLAPRAPAGPFVVFYDPWGVDDHPAVAARSVELLYPLGRVRIRCTNTPCRQRADRNTVELGVVAPGVDHVDVEVGMIGYRTVRFAVPLAGGGSEAVRVVVLTPDGTLVAPEGGPWGS